MGGVSLAMTETAVMLAQLSLAFSVAAVSEILPEPKEFLHDAPARKSARKSVGAGEQDLSRYRAFAPVRRIDAVTDWFLSQPRWDWLGRIPWLVFISQLLLLGFLTFAECAHVWAASFSLMLAFAVFLAMVFHTVVGANIKKRSIGASTKRELDLEED